MEYRLSAIRCSNVLSDPSSPGLLSRRRSFDRPDLPERSEVGGPENKNESNVSFADLGLSSGQLATLKNLGFERPTDIQRAMIPPALKGRDCLGQARTGTGKTAAFALPILARLKAGEAVQALILVPTRELAMQVGEHVRLLSGRSPLKTLMVYGGTNIASDMRRLRESIDIVVGTPGRVHDLIRRGALDLGRLKVAVVDEIDRMLDTGFREDILRILRMGRRERQTLFVSATINEEIRRLARANMRDPVEINVSADRLTVERVEQNYMTVDPHDKLATLLGLLQRDDPRLAIVFTRTKRGTRRVARGLRDADVACGEIHGDLAQGRRTRVLSEVREGKIRVLVATDLASRGLDVEGVSHVVNYDIPDDPAVYVHRVGRTARMGRKGYALTFVTRDQGKELTAIQRLIRRELKRLDPPGGGQHEPQRTSLPPAVARTSPAPARSAIRFSPAVVVGTHATRPSRMTPVRRFHRGRRTR